MSSILIIGAKSDIAKTIARVYANNGYDLILAGRNIKELNDFAGDVKIRNEKNIMLKELDITDFSSHEKFYNDLKTKPLGVIVVSGYMTDQELTQSNWDESLNTINVNYTGAVSILNIIADSFEKKKQGFIIGISSVAGDRGRKSNYLYGSAKAGFSAYLSGLRNRLYKANVHVLTVKPGFVDTKMTEHLDLPPLLTAQPEDVAKDIYRAQIKGKNVLYTKWLWKYIMLIIKLIPEFIFKKTDI
jgi:short-subunit dehydrogenase